MKKVFQLLNPLYRLGEGDYSLFIPLVFTSAVYLLTELFVFSFSRTPQTMGAYIIFISVGLVIYFSFRDGIRGGAIATLLTIIYYEFIIFNHRDSKSNLVQEEISVVILAILFIFLSLVIGWLKQRIDQLMERETNEKRRLETIIEQLPVGVLITDHTGRITQGNKQVEKILGRKIHPDVIVGRNAVTNATYNGKPVRVSQWPLVKALASGKTVSGKEFVITKPDGKEAIVQVDATVVRNKNGDIIAAASILNDITAQKNAERQKDEFIGIASHELKTPVTSIKAYAQVMKYKFEKSGDLDSAQQLAKMDAQLNKLTDLIGDLLDVTKIESGKIQFNEAVFNFDKLMREIVDQMQLTTDKHRIILRCKTGKKVLSDSERIGQILTNLISNAIKYSPHADKIIVDCGLVGKNIQVCVQDFGIGMSPRNKEKVFEQFYRVSGPGNLTFPGLGLGLYISSEIIKRLGGRIWVESEEGKGSTFCFTLPIDRKKSLSEKGQPDKKRTKKKTRM